MSPASNAKSGDKDWRSVAITSKSGLGKHTTDYVQGRIEQLKRWGGIRIFADTERLFIWQEGQDFYAYIHEDLIE